jgi:putative transposase
LVGTLARLGGIVDCHTAGPARLCQKPCSAESSSPSFRRIPPALIQYAVWIYLRFTLSYRDVEDLLAERGLDVTYETVRRWVLKFGPAFAQRLRHWRPKPSGCWHLDAMVAPIFRAEAMQQWHAATMAA